MREVERVMERERKKGRCPLRFERLLLSDEPYKKIVSAEQLKDVISYLLRIKKYSSYATAMAMNNIYLDVRPFMKKHSFRRARSIVDREEIGMDIAIRKVKLKPDYEDKVYLEMIRCEFYLPTEEREKWRMKYQGKESYGFPLSNKYLLGLFTYCEEARKNRKIEEQYIEELNEIEHKMWELESIRDVLFQALLLDTITQEGDKFYADLCSILLLR